MKSIHSSFSYLFLLVLFMATSVNSAKGAVQISYTLSFDQAQAHYVDIEMNISGLERAALDLKMPVWTPGSYLVREFAKNVESFSAMTAAKALPVSKTSKNCWHIPTAGIEKITVRYRVYCFEISVRTSFVDAAQAFISPAGIFVYPDQMLHLPATVHIVPYKGWNKVTSSLAMLGGDPFTRKAPNYDILFDSPIQVGNQDVFDFQVAGVKYEVAMTGSGNYDKEHLKTDIAKIVAQETAVFGENPNTHYVFLVHNYSRGGGGLEHLSSSSLGFSRDNYASPAGYHSFLGLVAHEHFHLWNVKRLRPIALGPFDYDHENYTTDLWIAEGFTTYYQNMILLRAGLLAPDSYLNAISGTITNVENQPGAKVQTLAESSFDAWIKAYRPNENSYNTGISYYDKGALVGLLLDLEIIKDSKGVRSLDDVMKYMYHTYYKEKHRGYTDTEFKQALEKFAGKNLDNFYAAYIYGLTPLNYNKYLGYAGYQLSDELAQSNEPSLGVNLVAGTSRKIVASVLRGSAAWTDGINVNDELLAVDGQPIGDLATMLEGKKPGDQVQIALNRDGLPLTLNVTLVRNDRVKYKIAALPELSPEQLLVRKKWLGY